jgi:hypothetical protein
MTVMLDSFAHGHANNVEADRVKNTAHGNPACDAKREVD